MSKSLEIQSSYVVMSSPKPVGHHLVESWWSEGCACFEKMTHYSQQPVSYGVWMVFCRSAKQHFKSICRAKDRESKRKGRRQCCWCENRETAIFNFSLIFFSNNVEILTVPFDQFNVSLLNRTINFFVKNKQTKSYWLYI